LGNGSQKLLNFNPEIDVELLHEIKEKIIQLHYLMGLSSISRTDFKICNNKVYILDVNAMPNLEPEKSFLPRICQYNQISYNELVSRITKFSLTAYENLTLKTLQYSF